MAANSKKQEEVSKKIEQVLDFFDILIEKDGLYYSPTLKIKDAKGKTRTWTIVVKPLISIFDRNEFNRDKLNRDELMNKPKIETVYFTISGLEDGKQVISAEKTVSGKGLNTKGETTSLTQAILDARSEYNEHIKKGYVSEADFLSKREIDRPFPMALHDVSKKNNWSRIHFPAYIQPKYDGTLFIQKLKIDELTNKILYTTYSRGRETYVGQEQTLVLEKDFKCFLSKLKDNLKIKVNNIFLIGELWKKGYSLQDISGATRQQEVQSDLKLEYHIFDISVYPPKNDLKDDQYKEFEDFLKFKDRLKILDIFFSCNTNPYIKQVPTILVKDKAEAESYYNKYLNDKLEGAVIRNIDAPYEWGEYGEIRVYHSLKWKPRFDEEFILKDFKQGTKGKEVGAIIFILATKAGKEFSATPNWPYDIRQKAFKTLSQGDLWSKIKGAEMVVSFSIKSQDGVPQQPKVLGFRDERLKKLLFS